MKRRLRVLRISHSATVSSYRERERVLSKQCDLDLLLIHPRRWTHLGGTQEPIQESFASIAVDVFGAGSIPLFVFDPLPLVKTITDFQPDLVDIHEEPYSASCFEALLIARKFAPHAACLFYSAQNIKKRYPPPFSWSERFVYRNSQGAYPCSTSVRDVLLDKGFVAPSPVIPLGVNPVEFSPHIEPLKLGKADHRQFLIGYTGRLEACKGIEYLFQALNVLKPMLGAEQPTPHLLIAGAGSAERELRELAQKLEVAGAISWLGELPVSKMPSFYTACDVIVTPSITTPVWREQFGRVPVEAMACGVPVITSDSGSLPEVVDDAGLIVPERDASALAEAICQLLMSDELQNRLTENGLKRVRQKYTWERVAAMMLSLYQEALERKHNGNGGEPASSWPEIASAKELVSKH